MRFLGEKVNLRVISFMKPLLLSILTSFSLSISAQISTDSSKAVVGPRKVQKVTYHQPEYTYTPKNSNYVSAFALGLDYSQESYLNNIGWDSMDQLKNAGGFNIYWIGPAIGRNLWNQNGVNSGVLNWGGGFNFNHYRSGDKYNVEFNTVNRDSGYTKLKTSAFQFYLFARYEYQMGRVYPFFAINAGVNGHSTNQYTQTYLVLTEYESSRSENIESNANVYFAPEVGLRMRISPYVSIVSSYQQRMGTEIGIVDLHNSKFNGLMPQYSANLNKVKYETGMFKIGFLFDLSMDKHEKKIVKEGYYDTTEVLEYPPTASPCPPCPCENKSRTTTPTNSRTTTRPNQAPKVDMDVNPGSSGTISPSNSSNSSGNSNEINVRKQLPTISAPKVIPIPKPKS